MALDSAQDISGTLYRLVCLQLARTGPFAGDGDASGLLDGHSSTSVPSATRDSAYHSASRIAGFGDHSLGSVKGGPGLRTSDPPASGDGAGSGAAVDAALTARRRQVHRFCMRLLGSRMTPSVVPDQQHMADLISKKFVRNGENSKALRFASLYAALKSNPAVKNKWAILYLLFSITQDPSSTGSTALDQSFSTFGLQSLPSVQKPPRPPLMSKTSEAQLNWGSVQDTASPIGSRPSTGKHTLVGGKDSLSSASLRGLSGRHKPSHAFGVTEGQLLRDLIFVFQGIDGSHVRYNAAQDRYAVGTDEVLSKPTRDLVEKIAEMGWMYRRVQMFIDQVKDQTSLGLVGQSFCSSLQQELSDYFRLIAVLEGQIIKSDYFDSNASPPGGLTLRRLYVWTQEPMQRLRMMSILTDLCRGQKGGALVSLIHSYMNHGDPFVKEFIHNLLKQVSKPFFSALGMWIYMGELDDPFNEFFVACDAPNERANLWRAKYSTRADMVPSFINKALAKKIFLIGKSLNFIRFSCQDEEYIASRAKTLSTIQGLQYGDIGGLEALIESLHTAVSKKLLDLLYSKYKLMEHMTALKRFLLLGQGDFIQYLMDSLGPSLSKPAGTLFRHNLTGTLESAIRSSNAQFDSPDILRRLDVRLLEVSSEDCGWDVFSLDYHVDQPISTIFSPPAMQQYLKLFNFLWRLKRVEHELSSNWSQQMTTSHAFKQVPHIASDIHKCHLVWGEMIHFIYQLQYYILFEVLECSWDELVKFLDKRTGDLDSLIGAHNKYLNNITSKGLLATSTSKNLLTRLIKLFDIIHNYKAIQDSLHVYAIHEIQKKEKASGLAYTKTLEAKWGLADDQESVMGSLAQARSAGAGSRGKASPARTTEGPEDLAHIRLRIREGTRLFHTELTTLLSILASQPDVNLRFLSFRLNFNEHYK